MSLEWIDPPRNWQDTADDHIKELRANPGRWARIPRNADGMTESYIDYLQYEGIEWRIAYSEQDGKGAGRKLDLYARAPKEGK